MHVALLVVLGILGQCSPVYPYVDLSGWTTLLAISIHVLGEYTVVSCRLLLVY